MSTPSPDKSAQRGVPSLVWRAGQARRLEMIRQAAPLEGARVLVDGCGLGAYVARLREFTPHVFGLDIEFEYLARASRTLDKLTLGAGERLPFPADCFDVVLSHEVIEHVQDDRAAAAEMVRVLRSPDPMSPALPGSLSPGPPRAGAGWPTPVPAPQVQAGQGPGGRPGGRLVLFCPNRWYPVETHGVYWRGRYTFGNIPLVNYLPDPLRDRLAPHVRAYTARGLRRLFDGLPVRFVAHTRIFGGYDNLIARFGPLGKIIRGMLYSVEHTPLNVLGLSHFAVIEKDSL